MSRADIDPNSGIDLVRIGSVGNAPWMGNGQSGDEAIGHGAVSYEYSMGKLEVTTAQWCEFFNAVYDRPDSLNNSFIHAPAVWGAVTTAPTNGGPVRWTVPAGKELIPVGGISWRTAAIYCNWLNNNKGTAPSAFMNGAYDVSTFGDNGNAYTDQITHNANARYWIPTWDEYIKAAHFDPNRSGPGQAGYWVGDTTLTHFAISGPPGTGEANYGFTSPNPFAISLGSYPTVQSAWGLLDLAGATSEWTEKTLIDFGVGHGRFYEGSSWGSDPNVGLGDSIYTSSGGDSPNLRSYGLGFRIASSVPAPGTCIVGVGVLILAAFSRTREGTA
jgi:sulfatase modifying factor 1